MKNGMRILRLIVGACIAGLVAVAGLTVASANGEKPGNFDFYVLALSWSPSFCATGGDNSAQCRAEPAFGFIVHGLWPENERGWPSYCPNREPERVPNSLVSQYFDITPSTGLMGHMWRKHGSCSGLSQADYFALVRKAARKVEIPARYRRPNVDASLDPDAIEHDFIAANPGISAAGAAVACENRALSEVRICMTKSLEFRPCAEIDAKACPLPRIEVPAPGN